MIPTHARVPAAPAIRGQAAFLESEPGHDRTVLVDAWVAAARQHGMVAWHLSGDVDEHGIWAGMQDLLESLLPAIRQRAPELIEKHSYELCLVLPALRRELTPRNPSLTDAATDQEKVRNYPSDRAFRSLHGIIELLDEWHATHQGGDWAIAVDDFDRATPLVHRFFAELLRRRVAASVSHCC